MKHTANPLLQPLRIPYGWHITFNNFRELDVASLEPSSELWEYFKEDLLQLEHKQHRILIDLGWYPNFNRQAASVR